MIMLSYGCKKEDAPISHSDSHIQVELEKKVRKNLERLSIGLQGAVNHYNQPTAKLDSDSNPVADIIYYESAKGLDGYYYVTYDRLIELSNENNLDLINLMDEAINEAYNLPDGTQTVTNILNPGLGIYNGDKYHVLIPFLADHLSKTEDIGGKIEVTTAEAESLTDSPNFAFVFNEDNYPVPQTDYSNNAVTLGQLDLSTATNWPTFINMVGVGNECIIDPANCNRHLRFCSASDPICDFCEITPSYTPGILPDNASTYGPDALNLQHLEVTIWLDYFDDAGGLLGNDTCYSDIDEWTDFYEFYGGTPYAVSIEEVPYESQDKYYANLYSLIGSNYYNYNSNNETMLKVEMPIRYINFAVLEGNSMSLCRRYINYHSYNEYDGGDGDNGEFGLAMGGVYKIQRLNMPPMYFAYPYGERWWYTQGPDMNVAAVSRIDFNSLCMNGEFEAIPEFSHYSDGGSEFEHGLDLLGLDKEVLISQHPGPIQAFWNSPKIFVGFVPVQPSSSPEAGNFIRYDVNDNTEGWTNSADLGGQNLIGQATKIGDNYILENILSESLNAGDQVTVRIEMTHSNNQTEVVYNTLTLQSDSPDGDINHVTLFLTGNIYEYDVKIYK